MENPIPTRIFEFLKNIPPFSLLNEKVLEDICKKVVIRYVRPGEVVFYEGDTPKPFIYVVHDGAVHLLKKKDDLELLADQCGEGDLFGLRPVVAKDNYLLSAVAHEETLLYQIRVENLEQAIQDQPSVAWYLAQSFAAAKLPHQQASIFSHSFHSENAPASNKPLMFEIQSFDFSKEPVTCGPEQTIRETAIQMRAHNIGSMVVVNVAQHPIGILTDRDLRNLVVTGNTTVDARVSEIMSSPVITIGPGRTIADVQIEMMRHRIHHICITENGNTDSKLTGIISDHDLLVHQGNHPAILMREMQRCNHAAELNSILVQCQNLIYQYFTQGVSVDFVSGVVTEIYDVCTKKAIEISLEKLEIEGLMNPATQWCWVAIGSAGREEQILRTDQDHAILFSDVPEQEYEKTQQFFLSLASNTTSILQECGFAPCPAEMMASNIKWCMSLTKWREQFSSWINEPTKQNVMFCNIFFDYRPIFGDHALTGQLATHIIAAIQRKSIFLQFLAKNAIQNPPPLTFFRNFVVEKEGTHKDAFDIKARAMMPLTDAARVLILDADEPFIQNTIKRFEKLAELEPHNKELFEQAAEAYAILVRYRALHGLKYGDGGRYLDPSSLTKMERLSLRNCFRSIRDVQELLQVRFQLSILM